MNFKEFLNEARRNPDQNPKVSAYQKILDRHGRTRDRVGSVTNLFVSFTSVDKLGINPRSKYDTPLGIYSYPSDYIIRAINPDTESMTDLPFAGDSPFVNLFESRGNVIVINKTFDVNRYYQLISEVYSNAYLSNNRSSGTRDELWKQAVDEVEMIINDAPSKAKHQRLEGGRFWYVSMEVAKIYAQQLRISKVSTAWNKLFRDIGIDGFVDTGSGIIHTSEPTQAVFFHGGAITKNERVYNRWSKESIKKGEDINRYRQKRLKGRIDELKLYANKALESNDIDDIIDVMEEIAIKDADHLGNLFNKLAKRVHDFKRTLAPNHRRGIVRINRILSRSFNKAKVDMVILSDILTKS